VIRATTPSGSESRQFCAVRIAQFKQVNTVGDGLFSGHQQLEKIRLLREVGSGCGIPRVNDDRVIHKSS
jgi:hypothetical protein